MQQFTSKCRTVHSIRTREGDHLHVCVIVSTFQAWNNCRHLMTRVAPKRLIHSIAGVKPTAVIPQIRDSTFLGSDEMQRGVRLESAPNECEAGKIRKTTKHHHHRALSSSSCTLWAEGIILAFALCLPLLPPCSSLGRE